MNIKYQKRIFLFFGVLFFFFDNKSLVGAFLDGKTFFFPRSDHSKVMATRENAYHSLFFKGKAGEQEYFSKKGRPFADVVFSCNHSFGSDDIASYFFGQDKLIFSGSRSASRQSTHILSDYFGTTSDFQSTVSFSPVVRSASVCFSTGIGLEALCKKLYAKITLPFVYKSFDMRLKENVTSQGINSHPAGYMSGGNQPLSKTVLVHNIKTAFKGEQSFGDMRTPLQYGKIDGVQKKFSCADITIEVFRKIINKRKKQLDVYIKGVIPTASSADARYLFEPIVGSNDHWQLGLGMSGSYFCLENEEKERKVQLCADFELLHLFSSKQKRSFDLKNNGFGSRYMLMQEFNSFSDGVFSVPGSVPYQYSGSLLPVINKTTLDCRVKVAVQADLLLNCIYFYKERWKINGGYNLWMRSSEKIYNRKLFKNDVYGLKGDTQMYGFFTNTVDVAVPLNATQSEATLCKAQGSGNLRQTLLYFGIH